MHKITLFILLSLSFFTKFNAQGATLQTDSIYYQMKKVADWQWKTLETDGWKNHKKDWTSGAMYAGMMDWAQLANNESYYKKLIQVGEDNKWKIGRYRQFADDYCVGQLYSQLYTIYKDPKFISDFKSIADTIVALPHTESLEWKNGIYTREWAWCDALFMGPPALGYLSQATGDLKYLDKASALWWKSTSYLFDKDENLYYRDSRYFNKKEKNGTKVFWARGNGWVIGGLVRVLSVMPENHPDRKKFIDLFKKMSEKLATIQQPDGTWHASLLDPESYPSKETSGTGFICYAMAWGVNNDILPYKKYQSVIYKAWDALSTSVHPDGKLGFVQAQGAAPDKVGYEDTDVYGVGAFLLAGSEMFRLNLNHKSNIAIVELVNSSSTALEQTIEVPWKQVSKKIKNLYSDNLSAINAATGESIAVKIEYKGKKPEKVIIKKILAPGSSVYVELAKK